MHSLARPLLDGHKGHALTHILAPQQAAAQLEHRVRAAHHLCLVHQVKVEFQRAQRGAVCGYGSGLFAFRIVREARLEENDEVHVTGTHRRRVRVAALNVDAAHPPRKDGHEEANNCADGGIYGWLPCGSGEVDSHCTSTFS